MKTIIILFMISSGMANAIINVQYSKEDCSKPSVDGTYWKSLKPEIISLMAQPIAIPRPKETKTPQIEVKAIHDGKWMQYYLSWVDKEKSDGGKLGTFSDGVAIQVPVKDETNPPPIFMGGKNQPVHVLHWRLMFQKDKEMGMRSPKDYYPNMFVDIYPFEFSDYGKLGHIPDNLKESYSHGKAAGNAQSYAKINGIDEITAEGFGSSQVLDVTLSNDGSRSDALWRDGKWNVVIARPLKREKASELIPGKSSFIAFAVWQGGDMEVGSRKSVTMMWTPQNLSLVTTK